MRSARLLLAVSVTASLGCESAQVELRCPTDPCEGPATEVPVDPPAPPALPVPPEVQSTGCEHPATVGWTRADLANEQAFDLPCITERLDENGCVGERVEHRFDARGLVIRSERSVFDPDVLTPTFVPPTSAITTFAYDAAGRRTARTHDDLADGTVDVTERWTYDERDRAVVETRSSVEGTRRIERTYDDEDRVTLEQTIDGARVHRRARAWHPSGALLFEHVDRDGERIFSRENELDDAGRPLVERQHWPVEGKTETTTYLYDALGLATRVWARDTGTGTRLEERHRFTRWADGTLRTEVYEQVFNRDEVRRRSRAEFDEAGRELSRQNDRNVDGIYESGVRYTYDAEGRRLTEYTFDGDRVLRDVQHRFDAEGRPIERTDRVRGTIVQTFYDGPRVRVRTTDLDGTVLSENTTLYDADERVLSIESDKDGDGRIDQRFENAWSDDGLLLGSRGDRDGDGVWDYATAQMYDRAGQLLYSMSDQDNDARPERAELHSYACQRP